MRNTKLWIRSGTRNGKPNYRYCGYDNWQAKPIDINTQPSTTHPNTLPVLTFGQVMELKPGDVCPKCHGTGIYRWHCSGQRKVKSSTCYWCNDARTGAGKAGKGWIDARDLLYIFGAAAEGRLNYTISA